MGCEGRHHPDEDDGRHDYYNNNHHYLCHDRGHSLSRAAERGVHSHALAITYLRGERKLLQLLVSDSDSLVFDLWARSCYPRCFDLLDLGFWASGDRYIGHTINQLRVIDSFTDCWKGSSGPIPEYLV